jgi:hypothetical protein
LPVGLPGILRDQHRDRGPRTACCASSHSYWGFGGGEFRTRGTRFSEFPAEGSRWQTRDVLTDRACWSRARRPIGRGTILGISSDAAPASSIGFPTTMNCSYGSRLATDNRLMST